MGGKYESLEIAQRGRALGNAGRRNAEKHTAVDLRGGGDERRTPAVSSLR